MHMVRFRCASLLKNVAYYYIIIVVIIFITKWSLLRTQYLHLIVPCHIIVVLIVVVVYDNFFVFFFAWKLTWVRVHVPLRKNRLVGSSYVLIIIVWYSYNIGRNFGRSPATTYINLGSDHDNQVSFLQILIWRSAYSERNPIPIKVFSKNYFE